MFGRIKRMLFRLRHDIGAFLGTVGYETCLENECDDYCGTSPTGHQFFWENKFRKNQLRLVVSNRSQEKHRL